MSTPEEVGVVVEEYGDFHKIVLQGIMAAGILDLKGVKALFNAACDYERCTQQERVYKTSMDNVLKIVRGINEQIKSLNMAIKSATCEMTGHKYFIFILTVEKSILKHQLVFSKVEMDMFLTCLDGILRKHSNFSLPFNEAINMLRNLDPRSSLTTAEEFIHKMIRLQYYTKYMLDDSEEFDVTLGVRGIREFEPLLVDMYGDVVQSCSLCRMILLHGYQCPNCKILFHKTCFKKYIAVCKQCKSCKMTWTNEQDMLRRTREIVEEPMSCETDEQEQSQDSSNGRDSPQPGPSGTQRLRNPVVSQRLDDSSDSEVQESSPPSKINTNNNNINCRTTRSKRVF